MGYLTAETPRRLDKAKHDAVRRENAALKEIAHRLQKMSYRDLLALAEAMDGKGGDEERRQLCQMLLTASDTILGDDK